MYATMQIRASADAKHSRAVLCLYVDSARLVETSDVPSAVAGKPQFNRNTLSNVYKGHVIRDTFWRLVNFQRKIRDRLVLRYQVLGHAIAEIWLPGVVPSQSPPCT